LFELEDVRVELIRDSRRVSIAKRTNQAAEREMLTSC
jgi:hypothetical protein